MGILVFLAAMWIFVSIIREAVKKANEAKAREVMLPPDFFGTHALPPEHVVQLGGVPAALLAAGSAEESSSEEMRDEAAGGHDLDLAHAEVVTLEPVTVGRAATRRPLPSAPVTLETEVDWNAEHQRFHKRYVDAPSGKQAPAHGLLDELRDPASARRAVLMAEILGPPVSLRGPR
jgi:hypothetical protein